MTEISYADSGVDVALGNEASKVLYNAAKLTWVNRQGKLGELITPSDSFRSLRGMHVGGLPMGTMLSFGFDGVGTKMELGERIGKHDTVAFDLFAMVCDDAARYGAEPVLVGSVLDVRALKSENKESYIGFVKELAKGYIAAAKAANVAVINGEIAELGARVHGYGPFNYNWGAGVAFFYNNDRAITGQLIRPGQKIVSLGEDGVRSNGLSLIRRIMEALYGPEWHTTPEGAMIAEAALTPSSIYCKVISELVRPLEKEGRADISGIAHITGGGIPEKFGGLLENCKYGATLDSLFDPPAFVQELIATGKTSVESAYNTWNMGNGMLVVTSEPQKVIAEARAQGKRADEVGEITEKPGLRIRTYKGNTLTIPRAA